MVHNFVLHSSNDARKYSEENEYLNGRKKEGKRKEERQKKGRKGGSKEEKEKGKKAAIACKQGWMELERLLDEKMDEWTGRMNEEKKNRSSRDKRGNKQSFY